MQKQTKAFPDAKQMKFKRFVLSTAKRMFDIHRINGLE